MTTDICALGAVEMARLLRIKALSAREVMAAHLARIERLNPAVNAIVTLVADRAIEAAAQADEALARGEAVGPLHGLPIAHKDLQPTAGIRTTFGSPLFKEFVPAQSSLLVERIARAGAIAIGKTNTPEFGAGSQTFNPVFGPTRNPYDLSKTCGGSTGGGAVALACGMLPIADGTDMGGSLRNPASFCNVVGLRPSAGLVPVWPSTLAWSTLSVDGPMARSAADAALLLSALAGPDSRSPIGIAGSGDRFAAPLERDFRGVRVAWCPDLGGLPLDPRVRDVLAAQRATFESLGCVVEDVAPDLKDAEYAFITIRSFRTAATLGPLLDQHRDLLKKDAIEEIEAGRAITNAELARAMLMHAQLMERMRKFQETYAFTLCAVNQVPPFDAKIDWPHEIAGVRMEHYIAWQKTCYWISATQRPAISVPAGFTPEGLPVGIQIVGRHREDRSVLELARAFEQATKFGERRPPI